MAKSNTLLSKFQVDRLSVEIHSDREAMGRAAAIRVAQQLGEMLRCQHEVSIVFASAPSQEEFLASLGEQVGIDWQRVVAFHMDEYVGLAPDAPQSFGQFLKDRLFDRVRPGAIHYLYGNTSDLDEEIERYIALLQKHPLDITCAGIGENGHLAFNDPPVADFDDHQVLKVVELTSRSRQQQVHDGCFNRLDDVPRQAITLTIPALLSSRHFSCVVPARSKAEAVKSMLAGPISTSCPASILRRHPDAVLYLEPASAAALGSYPADGIGDFC